MDTPRDDRSATKGSRSEARFDPSLIAKGIGNVANPSLCRIIRQGLNDNQQQNIGSELESFALTPARTP